MTKNPVKTTATATVMPAGSLPPVVVLEDGEYDIEIVAVGDYVEVKYPCGWTREHDTSDLADLMVKIANNLRARYGRADVDFLNTPTIEPGSIVKVKVGNGA